MFKTTTILHPEIGKYISKTTFQQATIPLFGLTLNTLKKGRLSKWELKLNTSKSLALHSPPHHATSVRKGQASQAPTDVRFAKPTITLTIPLV